MELIEYSKCSTCKKAEQFLNKKLVEFNKREIKEQTPTVEEMKHWIFQFKIPINKLFNTSGIKYREMNLKEKLKNMSDIEKLNLLSSDGMLIKRPILITKDNILIGFNEKIWSNYFDYTEKIL